MSEPPAMAGMTQHMIIRIEALLDLAEKKAFTPEIPAVATELLEQCLKHLRGLAVSRPQSGGEA